jgi:hypothetical protein
LSSVSSEWILSVCQAVSIIKSQQDVTASRTIMRTDTQIQTYTHTHTHTHTHTQTHTLTAPPGFPGTARQAARWRCRMPRSCPRDCGIYHSVSQQGLSRNRVGTTTRFEYGERMGRTADCRIRANSLPHLQPSRREPSLSPKRDTLLPSRTFASFSDRPSPSFVKYFVSTPSTKRSSAPCCIESALPVFSRWARCEQRCEEQAGKAKRRAGRKEPNISHTHTHTHTTGTHTHTHTHTDTQTHTHRRSDSGVPGRSGRGCDREC